MTGVIGLNDESTLALVTNRLLEAEDSSVDLRTRARLVGVKSSGSIA